MTKVYRIMMYALLGIYSIIIGLPILWMAISGLKTIRELFAQPFDLPQVPQWSNILKAWESGISKFFLNSVGITAVSVIAIVLVSSLAAYALARMRFPGRIPVYLMLIAGFAIPVHATLVPLYQSLGSAGLINTYAGIIGPYVAFGIPFSVLLLYAFFMEFPSEIEDAAKIDGCNLWQMMFLIVLPISMPGLSTVAIFQSVFLWNEFSLALILINKEELRTIPLGLMQFQGEWSTNWPVLLASLTLASLPMLLIYIVLQRQFIDSLSGFSK
jgi:ABC-type glycerol-3-phosphate transport system permease component